MEEIHPYQVYPSLKIQELMRMISIKLGINISQQTLLLNSLQLLSSNTISFYQIEKDNILELGYISVLDPFIPEVSGQQLQEEMDNPNSPTNNRYTNLIKLENKFFQVKSGINFSAKCQNQLCTKFNIQFIYSYGEGCFDLQLDKIICPECKCEIKIQPTTSYIVNSFYSWTGISNDENKRTKLCQQQLQDFEDQYLTVKQPFASNNYHSLKIYAKSKFLKNVSSFEILPQKGVCLQVLNNDKPQEIFCGICKQKMISGITFTFEICKHIYHKICVKMLPEFLENTCPLCFL